MNAPQTVKAYLSGKSGGFEDRRYLATTCDYGALSTTMRYTITEDGRPYFAGGKLVAKGATLEECRSRAALAEAARILADTQHGIEGRLASVRDTKLVVFSRTEREWHRRQGIWPAELTVADVVGPCLAAFVADGGQAASC